MVMGPTCGMVLADLGAEVIKVEPVEGDRTRHLLGAGAGFFPMFNRNKKSIALDLRRPEMQAMMRRRIRLVQALRRYLDARGFQDIETPILTKATPEGVRDFLQRVPVDYPILLETPGPADASVWLGNTRGLLPYSVLVDAQAKVVRQKLGPFAHGEIEGWARP